MLGKLVGGGTPYLKLRRDNCAGRACAFGSAGDRPARRRPRVLALLKIVENIP